MKPLHTIILIAYVLLIAGMALVHVKFGAAGDKDWLLMAARMWLGGKQLYVDVMEVNPPLILWIYALAVKLSHIFSIADYDALNFLVLSLTLCSTFVCRALITRSPLLGGTKGDVTLFTLLALTVLILWANPSYFADREHIFITLVLPYLLRFTPTLLAAGISPVLRIIVAAMAGVGFCIKPHCLLLFIAVNVYHICRSRGWCIRAISAPLFPWRWRPMASTGIASNSSCCICRPYSPLPWLLLISNPKQSRRCVRMCITGCCCRWRGLPMRS